MVESEAGGVTLADAFLGSFHEISLGGLARISKSPKLGSVRLEICTLPRVQKGRKNRHAPSVLLTAHFGCRFIFDCQRTRHGAIVEGKEAWLCAVWRVKAIVSVLNKLNSL